MRCPSCQQENAESNAFCIFCGEDLRAEVSLPELQRQVRGLQQAVEEIRATLARYGMRLSPPGLGEVPPEAQPSRPREPVAPSAGVERAPITTSAGAPPGRPLQDIAYGERAPMPWDRVQVNWELVLGGNWMARIGVLAVVIGMGFFLKLAFDNDWIGETGRVVLGVVAGLAMLGGGEYWKRRYPAYAQALVGGAVALLYLTIFAAFAIFELIDLYPGIGLLFLISVASAALALRYESMALAIIGIFGAFVAPFAMGGFAQGSDEVAVANSGSSIQLMVYVMVVDVGVLVLSTFRSWRWFTLLGLLGSLISFGSWYGGYGDEVSLLTAQGSLTIIFLLFVGATTLFHIVWRRVPEAFDLSLMVINVAAYFGISYGLLWDDFRPWMGGFTLLLSLFYGGLAYAVLVRSKEHVYLSLMALGIALVLLTVAVPVQLGGPWVSVAWAAEGAVLMWLSFRLGLHELRLFSLGVFVTLAVHLLAFDTSVNLRDFRLILNYRMLAFASGVVSLYLAAYLMRRERDATQEWEKGTVLPALLVGASFLSLWVLSAEVIAAVDSGVVNVTGRTADHVKSLSLSLLWAVYASLALVLGIVKRWRVVRLAGLGLLVVPILKLFLFDSFALERGFRVAAFMGLGGILLVGGFLYQRYTTAIRGFLFEEQQTSPQS